MHTQKFKIRLGLFVAGGLTLFVLAIFIIGKQKNLFDPVFQLSSNFYNVAGLHIGNNVRFSGINVGTVDNIQIINDSTVRVSMFIKKDVWKFIKADCKVAIGSEGIIGDKMINILQGTSEAPLAREGQLLESNEPVETDAIIVSLGVTASNAEVVTKQLAEIMKKVNGGEGTLGRLVQDTALAENLNRTVLNLRKGSQSLDEIMTAAKHNFLFRGYFKKQEKEAAKKKEEANKGITGDNTLQETSEDPVEIDTIMASLSVTANNAEVVTKQLAEIMVKINEGEGTLGRLLQDTALAENLNRTILNLRKGSKSLDENMTAAKHNFLLRGYFKKQEKAAKKKKEKAREAAEEAAEKAAEKKEQEMKKNKD